jgi:hypothetical protein
MTTMASGETSKGGLLGRRPVRAVQPLHTSYAPAATDRRAGFALLAVLWVIVGMAALGLAVALTGRDLLATSTNRIHLARAAWLAEDCVERARAVIAQILAEEWSAADELPGDAWRMLDSTVPQSPLVASAGCQLQLRAAGTTLNLNTASERALHRLLELHRIPASRADSLVAALQDWRDPDRIPRPYGAERREYQAAGLHPPRDGPLADVRELRRVRGWAGMPVPDSLFGVDEDRLCLNHAPLAVIGTLPGITGETLARITERRTRDAPLVDLLSLGAEISAASADSLLAHHLELSAATTLVPDAWLLWGLAETGTPAVRVAVEVRLVRAGGRAAVVRRRSWIL